MLPLQYIFEGKTDRCEATATNESWDGLRQQRSYIQHAWASLFEIYNPLTESNQQSALLDAAASRLEMQEQFVLNAGEGAGPAAAGAAAAHDHDQDSGDESDEDSEEESQEQEVMEQLRDGVREEILRELREGVRRSSRARQPVDHGAMVPSSALSAFRLSGAANRTFYNIENWNAAHSSSRQ